MEITWQRFKNYHYAVGEDFLDQTGEGNHLVFGGWLLARYPEYSKEILKVCNDKYGECLGFAAEMPPLAFDKEKDIDYLYVEFAEFCNLTGALKERVNNILSEFEDDQND